LGQWQEINESYLWRTGQALDSKDLDEQDLVKGSYSPVYIESLPKKLI